jgi:uncharacterized caspase-like protein
MLKKTLVAMQLCCMSGLLYANTVLNEKPNLYAIIIGIGEYPNASFSLKYAKNDATAIYQKLKTQIGYTYTEGNLKLLNQPEQTSKAAIQAVFKDMQAQIKSEDAFILYIAGEADHLDNEYYLLSSQTQNFSAQQLKNTGFSATELKQLIAHIPTSKKLILLDTGMSDGIITASELNSIHSANHCDATMILAAGKYPLQGFREHSVFSYAILDALSGIADINKNGFIESDELAQYVR